MRLIVGQTILLVEILSTYYFIHDSRCLLLQLKGDKAKSASLVQVSEYFVIRFSFRNFRDKNWSYQISEMGVFTLSDFSSKFINFTQERSILPKCNWKPSKSGDCRG